MGIVDAKILTLARKIALYNCNAIYYVKNSLTQLDSKIQKELDNEYNKLKILIMTDYKGVDINLILANFENNHNHDLLKVDIDLIYDMIEEVNNESCN